MSREEFRNGIEEDLDAIEYEALERLPLPHIPECTVAAICRYQQRRNDRAEHFKVAEELKQHIWNRRS